MKEKKDVLVRAFTETEELQVTMTQREADDIQARAEAQDAPVVELPGSRLLRVTASPDAILVSCLGCDAEAKYEVPIPKGTYIVLKHPKECPAWQAIQNARKLAIIDKRWGASAEALWGER